MPDEKKDNDPMEGAPITAPKVDEASLLQDVRSPRFLAACNTLHIDPIELIPKPFEVFSERGLSQEKQQIRFAMYERGRLAKWTSLNECRRGLPKGGASKRSQSADPTMPTAKSKLGSSRLSAEGSAVSLGKSWIANELAKTSEIASRGQVEVYKTTYKALKDIQEEGRQVAREVDDGEKQKAEARAAAEQKRRMLIKRHNDAIQRQKEKIRREHAEMKEREEKFKEMDQATRARQEAMHLQWEAESAAKLKALQEHMERVQCNIDRNNEEREAQARRVLEDLARKEEQVRSKQEGWKKGVSHEGMVEKMRAAEQRRQEVAKQQQERAKQLLAEHKKAMLETERKAEERRERQRERRREQEKRDREARQRIADIQRKKTEILKERAGKVLDHMAEVEEKQAAYKARQLEDLANKAELERLRHEQVQEQLRRHQTVERERVSALDTRLENKARAQDERSEVFRELIKQRQRHSTHLRLSKAELKEQMFQIKVKNQWNRASQIMREIEPS